MLGDNTCDPIGAGRAEMLPIHVLAFVGHHFRSIVSQHSPTFQSSPQADSFDASFTARIHISKGTA